MAGLPRVNWRNEDDRMSRQDWEILKTMDNGRNKSFRAKRQLPPLR